MRLLLGRSGKAFIAAAASPLVGASYCLAAPPSFAPGFTTGNFQNSSIVESSGVAVSRFNPNVLWTHNDSGDSARVFAMTPAGVNLGVYSVTGASAFDWEDIAVGPGPAAGTQYLYLADIGDNAAIRPNVSVYRVPEPTVSDTQAPTNVSVAGMQKLTFAYPNGPHDAESLFVDPGTKDIYIVSKREATKYVYRAPYPQATSGTTTMQLVASLSNPVWITAADLSPDGDEIIMRGVESTSGLMYIRPAGGSIADALATTPISIPLVAEAQGEGIGFDPQGWGYYTTTEGASAPLRYFNRLPAPPGSMYWDNDGVAAGSRTSSGAGTGGAGTWNTSALKWYTGSAVVPWANGNDAIFWGTAGTVTLGTEQTVNSLSFKTSGYTVTGSTLTLGGSSITVDAGVTATIGSVVAGSAGLVKNGEGTLQLTTANTYAGGTTVNAGKLVVNRLHENNAVTITGGTLQVANSAPTLPSHPAGNNAFVSRPGSMITITHNNGDIVSLNPTTLAPRIYDGTLDLGNNDLVIDYDGASPIADVEDMIRAGYNGGSWNGKGIISSTAGSIAAAGAYTVGVIDNATPGITPFTTFSDQIVDTTTVLVKFVHRSDINMDGVVSFSDSVRFNGNYSEGTPTHWVFGDLNYNGVSDFGDSVLFNGGYDEALSSLPEPMSLGVLSLGLFGIGRRRVRNGR